MIVSEFTANFGASSEADFARAQRAVELGWVTKEQLEAAIVEHDRELASGILARLSLSPDQLRQLEADSATLAAGGQARLSLPAEVAEALKDPKRRIGRFVLVDLLGKGGMGMVFRGWQPELRQWVALKFLKLIGDDTARAYFKREAQLAASLDHPNIAKIYEIGEHDHPAFAPGEGASAGKQPFIAMQFVDGAPLSGKDRKLEDKLKIVQSIAEAVKFAHDRKIIHRDLKPANVMIDRNGQVYVMDFGLAKETEIEGESIGGSSLVVGTPSYMAPEQAKGKADFQSDVYGIGAILYELVTGRPPFTGETATDVMDQVIHQEPVWPRKLSPDTPEDVEAIILHALEKDPRRRYANTGELIEDIAACREKNPLRHARRPTMTYIMGKRIRKQPLLWAAGALMILSVTGGSAFTGVSMSGRNRSLADRIQSEKAASEVAEGRRRAEREERDKVEVERQTALKERDNEENSRRSAEEETRRANDKIAAFLFQRAREETDRGRWSAALSFSAEANSISSTVLRRADVAARLRKNFGLEEILTLGPLVTDFNFSPDGSKLAVASNDGQVRFWNLRQGGFETRIINHGGAILSIAFSPDGRRLATAGSDGSARLWDLDTGNAIGSPMTHARPVHTVRISSDGRRLVTATRDGIARLWDGETGAPVGDAFKHGKTLNAVEISAEAARLLTASEEDGAALWNMETGDKIEDPGSPGLGGKVTNIAFSKDGRNFVTAASDGTIRIRDSKTALPVGKPISDPGVWGLAISADGTQLATGGTRRIVRLWDTRTGDPMPSPTRLFRQGLELEHGQSVSSILFTPDGKRLVTGSVDRKARVWDLSSGHLLGFEICHDDWVTGVRVSPDGRLLATLSLGNELRLARIEKEPAMEEKADWNSEAKKDSFAWPGKLGEYAKQHRDDSRAVFSTDGRRVVTYGKTEVRAWERTTGEPVGKEIRTSDEIRHFALSPDGMRAVLACSKFSLSANNAQLWDLDKGEALSAPLKHDEDVHLIEFSPDGKRFATAKFRWTVYLWDGFTGRAIGREIHHGSILSSLAFSPDGRWLATLDNDRNLRVWDAETGEPVGPPTADPSFGRGLAWRPDGKRISVGAVVSTEFLGTADKPDAGELQARVDTGLRVTAHGDLKLIPPEEWRQLRDKLRKK